MTLDTLDLMTDERRQYKRATALLDRMDRLLREAGFDPDTPANGEGSGDDEIESLIENLDLDGLFGREILAAAGELADFAPGAIRVRPARLRVEISEDRMSAEAVVMPPIGHGAPLSVESAAALLSSGHGVTHGVDQAALAALLAEGATAVARGVIARGTPSRPGHGDSWELVDHDGQEAARSALLAEDRVDYRAMASVAPIEPAALLAVRIAEIPGVEGRDVTGRPIPPPPPIVTPPLVPGPGAEQHEDGIVALIAGEIRVEGRRVSVVPIRRIDGDVNLATGNVVFPGTVLIKGSVDEGFTVKAEGDIEIGGSIAGADVEATGSIRVGGGIVGREGRRVAAGGDLAAKFIENASVEARGEITVRKGILHSRVEALGRVTVTGGPGVVVGGVVRAGRGLVCETIGSVSGTQTRIIFGENYLMGRRLHKIERGISLLRDRLREFESERSAIETSPTVVATLSDRFERLRTKLHGDLRDLMTARLWVIGEAAKAPAGDVRVAGEAFPGVVLSSRGIERSIEQLHVRTRFRLAGETIEVGVYD